MSTDWPVPPAAVLRGEIVVMEPAQERHRAPLRAAAAAGGEDVFRWIGEHYATTDALWDRYFDEMLAGVASGADAAFITCDARTGEPVGSTRYLNLRPADRALEIGHTWITPSRWRTGANVEAKRLMLAHAFDDLRCVRVELKTDARNHRSRTAIAALGARFEGIHRKHRIMPRIGTRHTAWYSILDDEWPAVRARLDGRLAGATPAATLATPPETRHPETA